MAFDTNIVKNGGKYWSCRDLQWGISLDNNCINTCCIINDNNRGLHSKNPFFAPLFDNISTSIDFNEEFFQKIYEIKLEYIRKINDNEECICTGCHALLHREWEPIPKLKLNRFVFGYDYTCNSNCSYCPQDHTKRSPYDAVALVNNGVKLGYIDLDNVYYSSWGGGEPVLMLGFEELYEKLKNAKINNYVTTSAIKFSQQIADVLSNNGDAVRLNVSIDSGTPETYKKIKRVDQFDRVVENFDKYYKATANKSKLWLKYIVTPDNCSEKEIDSFLDLIKDKCWYGITVVISVDLHQVVIADDVRAGIIYLALKAPLVTGAPVFPMFIENFFVNDFHKEFNTDELGKLGKIKLLAQENGLSLDEVIELVKNSNK